MANKRNAGFTLVELIVVIVILAILAGVGTIAYGAYIKKANEAKDAQLLGDIRYAAALGAYTDPDVEGIVYVYTDADAVAVGRTAEDDAAVIGEWMANVFGGDWAETLRWKTETYSTMYAGGIYLLQLTQAQKNAVSDILDSKYAEKTEALLSSAGNPAHIFASGKNDLPATLTMDAGYADWAYQWLQNEGLDSLLSSAPDGSITGANWAELTDSQLTRFVNETALYIASATKETNVQDAYNGICMVAAAAQSGDGTVVMNAMRQVVTDENGNGMMLPSLALLYSTTVGYLNSEQYSGDQSYTIHDGGGNPITGTLEELSVKAQGGPSMMEYLSAVMSDPGYYQYFTGADGRYQQDIAAYIGVMNLLDDYSDEIQTDSESAITDPGVVALINNLLAAG